MATIGELGERIATLAKKVEENQKQNDVSSVDPDTAIELAEASRVLEQLVLGPRQTLGMMGLSVGEAPCLANPYFMLMIDNMDAIFRFTMRPVWV